MQIEWISQAAAVVVAAACALTDFGRGKVYNKVLLGGLVVGLAWLALMGTWRTLGGRTSLDSYPELGTWFEEPPPPPPSPEALANTPPEMRPAVPEVSKPPEIESPAEMAGSREVSVWGPDAPERRDRDRPGPLTSVDESRRELSPEDEFLNQKPSPIQVPEILMPDMVPALIPTFDAYLGRVSLNVLLAFAAGFLTWWLGFWAAGDAKLFSVLALLLPLSTYSGAFWPPFPAYVLLFNTFLAVMTLLVTELALRGARQAFRPTPDEAEAWRTAWVWIKGHTKDLARGFVAVLFLFLIIKALRMLMRDVLTSTTPIVSRTSMYFALCVLFYPLTRLMRHKWIGTSIIVATSAWILYATFFPTADYNLMAILSVGAISLVIIIFVVVYELYLNVFDFKAIGIWQLAPRMILAKRTREVLKEDMDLIKHKLGDVGPDGLSPEQAETVRRWWIDHGKGGRIHVSRTIPFAPALFFGTIMTVLLGGYIWITPG
jgi:Flp pilus assembly protein protease CpaA